MVYVFLAIIHFQNMYRIVTSLEVTISLKCPRTEEVGQGGAA